MTRAEMKKIYAKVFLGILIFALFIAAIFIAGEVRRRLDTGEQYLIKEAEPPRLLTVKANVSVLTLDEMGYSAEVTSMQTMKDDTPYFVGGNRTFIPQKGIPDCRSKGDSCLMLSLKCTQDGFLKVKTYGAGASAGEIRIDGSFAPDDRLLTQICQRADVRVDTGVGYIRGRDPRYPTKRLAWPDIPEEEAPYHRIYEEMLSDLIPGLNHYIRGAFRYVKEGTVIVTCHDRTNPERILAEAEIRIRKYEEFRLDSSGISAEYYKALRENLPTGGFTNVDLQRYFPYLEAELVRYEQIDIWD